MAEFLTVNLGSVLKNQKAYADFTSIERKEISQEDVVNDFSQISDWAMELNNRLSENRAKAANERVDDEEIETLFFKDYFNNAYELWDETCAKQLISFGKPLQKALKVLGFNEKRNPILGFIVNPYVVTNLIKPGLLNVNTFKAIYSAVSNRLVAHTQFMRVNDYNIIYCRDLYNRPAAEMLKYLGLQANILKPSTPTYEAVNIEKNKKVFFFIKKIKEQDNIKAVAIGTKLPSAKSANTKLNSIDFANKLAGTDSRSSKTTTAANNSSSKPGFVAKKIINTKNNKKAYAFAAVQYVSATTDIPEAKKALSHTAFRELALSEVVAVSGAVNKFMKEAALNEAEAGAFISILISSLEGQS
jgi:hypothetical protein